MFFLTLHIILERTNSMLQRNQDLIRKLPYYTLEIQFFWLPFVVYEMTTTPQYPYRVGAVIRYSESVKNQGNLDL